MKKVTLAVLVLIIMFVAMRSDPVAADVSMCVPTATKVVPTSVPPTVVPTVEPTRKPKKKKTVVVTPSGSAENCPSDCEFKSEVLRLLEEILIEVRK